MADCLWFYQKRTLGKNLFLHTEFFYGEIFNVTKRAMLSEIIFSRLNKYFSYFLKFDAHDSQLYLIVVVTKCGRSLTLFQISDLCKYGV